MRILLAEDDEPLGRALRAGLAQAGFSVDWVRDGVAASNELAATPYSAVVLDVGLPREDGLTVLRRLRAGRNPVPVLVLTARDAVGDRVAGLDGGADDYVVKPVDLVELAARLRALIRRSAGQGTALLEAAGVCLDPAARTVLLDGLPVLLSPREFDLLHVLMLAGGRVLTREKIEEQLCAWGRESESNSIEVHVHRLRKRLRPELLRTIRGVGYAFGNARA
jgi:two-component system OmpR family response regulator/two-component system response regulator QseB